MAKNRVNFLGLKYIDKIVVIVILRISLWMVVMLVTPFMVFANSTDRIGTNRNDRITASSSETIVNSSEVDKNEKKSQEAFRPALSSRIIREHNCMWKQHCIHDDRG